MNLMPGINILAEYTAGGLPDVAIAVLSLMMIWCLIVALYLTAENLPGGIVAYVLATGLFVIIINMSINAEPDHTRYKVTISEDVKLVEFLERYEILDTEGEIYTIREVIPDA